LAFSGLFHALWSMIWSRLILGYADDLAPVFRWQEV
jgi:hypothetical protein